MLIFSMSESSTKSFIRGPEITAPGIIGLSALAFRVRTHFKHLIHCNSSLGRSFLFQTIKDLRYCQLETSALCHPVLGLGLSLFTSVYICVSFRQRLSDGCQGIASALRLLSSHFITQSVVLHLKFTSREDA